MSEVTIHTDGACRGNPGPGGWGAVLEYNGKVKEIFGGEPDTTNNRMEIRAAMEALKHLKRPCKVRLITDSTYVKQGVTTWLAGWKKNGWKTAAKKPVKNQELWQQLDQVMQPHDIQWEWVKGHSGDPGNEWADRLANQAIDEMLAVNS